jgi:CubicO group peptidase (beta-lactamase class C family)
MNSSEFKQLSMVAGGNAYLSKNHILESNKTPKEFNYRLLNQQENTIVNRIDNFFQDSSILAILLVDKNNILYEKYKKPVNDQMPLFSWSMSKSLIAYTLGYLIEDKRISLNDTTETYAPKLRGTVFGNARIKDLLTMSSGVKPSIIHGNQQITEWSDMKNQQLSVIEHLIYCGDQYSKPGIDFNYSGTDSEALCHLIDENGGFIKYFTERIWEPAQCESNGYWMLEKDDRVIAQAGFSATARDWIRIAAYFINEIKTGNKFFIDATSPQIKNNFRINASFQSYGYQTWTENVYSKNSFWLAGMHGQRIGIDADQEKIIMVSSYKEYTKDNLYKIFADFQTLIR